MRGLLEGQEVGSEREYGRLRFFSWAALSDGKARGRGVNTSGWIPKVKQRRLRSWGSSARMLSEVLSNDS